MEKQLRWFVIVLAWIGAIAILGAIGWGALFFAFKDFAGGNCTDAEQKILVSPDGSHSIKSFHREWKPAKDLPPEKEHYWIMARPGNIEADSIPMQIFAEQLTRLNMLGRMVVSKTRLTGNYNFTLRWTPDNDPFPGLRQMLKEADGLGAQATDAAVSPLFTALREQLGLRLEPAKDNVDVIVIDHIDPPSPN